MNTRKLLFSAMAVSIAASSSACGNRLQLEANVGSGSHGVASDTQGDKDTGALSTPTIRTPVLSEGSFNSNASSLSISGECETGSTVLLSGAAGGSGECISGMYSFTVTVDPNADYRVYEFIITQRDAHGRTSGPSNLRWIRNTIAPAAPIVVFPAASRYTSGDSTIVLAGTCLVGAWVILAGAASQAVICSESGTFSLTVSKSGGGTFSFELTQTDQAGNVSSSQSFVWVQDLTLPGTPTLMSPASNLYYSNGDSLTVSGACITGNEVTLSGDVLASEVSSPLASLTQTCSSSTYSFTLSKSVDSTYNLRISQSSLVTTGRVISYTYSAQMLVRWTRQTSAPSTPSLVAPNYDPYRSSGALRISGSCDDGATVVVTDVLTLAQTISLCSGLSFSLEIDKPVDGSYEFSVVQVDKAGNRSSGQTLHWTRDSTLAATPSVSTAANGQYVSADSSVIIAGGCTNGLTVTLSGDVAREDMMIPAGSLSMLCQNSTYLFIVTKSGDGTYQFNVKQSSSSADSGGAGIEWRRDTSPPRTIIASQPDDDNASSDATFTFASRKAHSTYECSLDSAAFSKCSSPMTYSRLANGHHTLVVRARDIAGNADPAPASYSWSQNAHRASDSDDANTP